MEDLIFISAQPDVPYFHWQVRIYVENFIELGIKPNQIHVVFGLVQGKINPTDESLKLKELGINVHHYLDERKQKHYIPNIKPFLVYKFLEENPSLGKNIFLHDADIIFRELPNFDKLLEGQKSYLSDTIGYIGYNYIMDCCKRYEDKHPNSEKGQLIKEMADIVGINVEVIKENQNNSGGGQYLIKNSDSNLWKKIYEDCTPLYDQMLNYQKRFPISPGEIQFWTAEMWSLLWNLWLHKYDTEITDELDFSWATDSIEIYNSKPILHMAGVTSDLKGSKFYKGDFINQNPINKLRENSNYFDYVDKNSSTIKYIEIMKIIIEKEG
jgi:hypothetical protein